MLPLTSRLAAQDSAAKMVADRRPAVRARYPHVRACVKMRAALCMPDTDSRRKSDERDGFEMVGTGCRWGWLVRHYLTAQSCLAETRRDLWAGISKSGTHASSPPSRARALQPRVVMGSVTAPLSDDDSTTSTPPGTPPTDT